MGSRRAAAALSVLALVLVGCGDNEPADTPKAPTSPGRTGPTTGAEKGTGTERAKPPQARRRQAARPRRRSPRQRRSPSGGRRKPTETAPREPPPPKGSPAERFERFCEQNPGACG